MIAQGQIFYDSFDNKVEVKEVLNSNTFLAIVYRLTKITFNRKTTEKICLEEKIYSVKDIGIFIFYNIGDSLKGKKLVDEENYKFNAKKIKAYHEAYDDNELKNIISCAPSGKILTEKEREKLIKSYSNKELQDIEETEFRNKYKGKYFGRMDFDVEYFCKKRPDLWKNNYYNKIYVGKHGTVFDENDNLVITDWRSPIGGFFSDNKNRFYNPNSNQPFIYNYELIMKRKFSDDCSEYATLFIADEEMYKDGDIDPFLIGVLTRLRRSGNDKAVDIIETIQAEQNAIVRENINTNFYVQGCAGSGKTMIMLHRLSCLLYNNNYLDTSKIKIITPNENIINQLKELSAELEISNIQQMTLEKYYIYLISEYSKSLKENMQIEKIDLKNETLLSQDFLDYVYSDSCIDCLNKYYENYFNDIFNKTSKYISVDNTYDFSTLKDFANKLYDLYSNMSQLKEVKETKEYTKSKIEKSLALLTEKYNEKINLYKKQYRFDNLETESELRKIEMTLLSEKEDLMSLKKDIDEIKSIISNVENEIKTIYPYTADEEKSILKLCNKVLHKKEAGIYDRKLQYSDYKFVFDILKPFISEIYSKYNIENNDYLYKHNLYFILYILIRIHGEKSINTIVNIDEAQDISINEYRIIKKTNRESIFNLYGDKNQLLFKNRGISKWEQLDNFKLKEFNLNINYRNISQITNYCNKVLSPFNMGAMGVQGDEVVETDISEIATYINKSTIVIVKNRDVLELLPINDFNFVEKKDDDICNDKINVMTVEMVKGMEFSNVIVVDTNMTKREKYVSYTRALNKLIVAR